MERNPAVDTTITVPCAVADAYSMARDALSSIKGIHMESDVPELGLLSGDVFPQGFSSTWGTSVTVTVKAVPEGSQIYAISSFCNFDSFDRIRPSRDIEAFTNIFTQELKKRRSESAGKR